MVAMKAQLVPGNQEQKGFSGHRSFAEFLGEVETYLSVLAPGLLARPRLEWAAAFRDQVIVMSGVEAYEVVRGNPTGTAAQSVQRQRRSQAQSSVENQSV